uniref:Phenoloxidase-activating factor 2 n=1 Tax=Lygus hesperus TaxID=30085 RepID=A0A0A9XVS9_LYGHE
MDKLMLLTCAVLLLAENAFSAVSDDELIANVFQTACKCIPFYQCQNGTQTRDGAGLIQYRLIAPKCNCQCQAITERCCYVPPENIPIDATTTKPIDGPTSTDKPEVTTSGPRKTTTRPRRKPRCGMRRVDLFETRIMGAKNKTKSSEFPWMVAIFHNEENNGNQVKRYMCAGSLIHERVVMTVAHCANQLVPENTVLRAGAWDLSCNEEAYPHQDRIVSQIIMHSQYNARYVTNDVALLVTTTPFKFAMNVDILCLPKIDDVVSDDSCIGAGWGKNETGAFQHAMKYVELPTVSRDECESKLQETRLGPYFTLPESVMCAGGVPGKDTCKGDGGSPLICPIKGQLNRYQQVGIVAAGIGCGTDVPGIYADVAFLRPWIDQQVTQLGFIPAYNY